MAEMMVLSLVAEVTKKLIMSLLEVRTAKLQNNKITKDIDEFVSNLNKNVALLKHKLPPNVGGGALDSLLRKLEEAQTFVQSRQDQKFFKSMWTAKQTTEKLNSQRRNLDSAFQLALFFTTLDVALEANKKIDDFQLKIQKISEDHSDNSRYARGEMQNILAPANAGSPQDRSKIAISHHHSPEFTLEHRDREILRRCKLSAHLEVLANISSQVGASESEGSTITTEGDDDDRVLRSPHIREALKLAHEGDDADALLMLENVLEWDDDDAECQRLREVISRRINQQKAERAGELELELDLPLSSSQEQLMNRTFAKEDHHRTKSFEAISSEKYQSSLKQRASEERVEGMGAVHILEDIVGLLSNGDTNYHLDRRSNELCKCGSRSRKPAEHGDISGSLEETCSADENVIKIAACPNTIGRVMDLLSKDIPVAVQLEAAKALANMVSVMEGKEWLVELIEYPGALPKLIDLLAKATSESLQLHAVIAIAHLTLDDKIKIIFVNTEGAVERLVSLLTNSIPISVQEQAVRAFGNLACAYEKKSMLVSFPGALEKLVTLLGRGVHSSLQSHAARAFANLTTAKNRSILVLFPGALEKLVTLLGRGVHSSSQSHAARAFSNLACADEYRSMMASFPGALENLVTLLGRGVDSSLQYSAASAFMNLTIEKENRVPMTGFPNAIERLVGLLVSDVEERVQIQAVGALANLAVEKENAVKLATYEEVISSLTNLLSRDVPEKVQSRAMVAFANLAIPNENARRLAEFPWQSFQECWRSWWICSGGWWLVDKLVALLNDPAASGIVQSHTQKALSRLGAGEGGSN
ncbi:hypothetical protein R1sor_007984 [Riccia sorocarpa]|uniref:Vacuolar protein 8 n=1 Tax=Riccia sorocarpa TaxID=122646 RepID=A0ABD3HS94_9MARC